jgi:hypothetical protein
MTSLFPPRESLVVTSRLGRGNSRTFFYGVYTHIGRFYQTLLSINLFHDLWQVLQNYSESLQKKFLLFTTGSDRVPVGGMGEMTFKITKLKVCKPYSKERHI